MAERADQDRSQATPTTAAAPTAAQGGWMATIQAMLSRGTGTPAHVASVMRANPHLQRDIVAFLQSTLGNSFVQAVVKMLSAPSPASEPPPKTAAKPKSYSIPAGPARVTASGLNVRRSPDTSSTKNIIGGLKHGASVNVLVHDAEWLMIEYQDGTAYIHGDYVESLAKPKPAETGAVASAPAAHAAPAAPAAPATHDHSELAHDAAPPAAHAHAETPVAHPPEVSHPVTPHVEHDPKATAPAPQVAAQQPHAEPHAAPVAIAKPEAKPTPPKAQGSGYVKYGGGSVRDALTKLATAGMLKITGKQIALLDAVAQVETGGQIGCVQTYDDQIVSVGFKQVVLGWGSLEKVMQKAPGGFAKHGITLDTSKTYVHDGWPHQPHQIVGCSDVEQLRGADWAMKFYAASMEPDVIVAMAELALGDAGKVEAEISKSAAGVDYFTDPTAEGWLLETMNNRPAFLPKAIQRAIADGAKTAKDRDKFLDILGHAIVETYATEEPLLFYQRAKHAHKGPMTPEQDAALRAEMIKKHEAGGRHKATNIITKISRHLEVPKVPGDKGASAATPAAAPAPKPAVQATAAHTDDHAAEAPHPAPAAHHEPAPHVEAQHAPAPSPVAHAAPAPTAAPATHPAPAPAPVTAHVEAAKAAPAPLPQPAATPAPVAAPHAEQAKVATPVPAGAAPGGSADMVSLVLEVDGQFVQVYVSPGGINNTPDIFMFFHGHDANLGIDPNITAKKTDNASGEDSAAAAMAQARAKNTIAILPQGVRGGRTGNDRTKEGGYMKALQDGKKDALPNFINDILAQVGPKLHKTSELSPGRISLAGHSAGGYLGIHDALSGAGKLADSITDITLMDTNYAAVHFADTANWMYQGSGNKTVRIVQAPNQIDPGTVVAGKWQPTPEKRFYNQYFGETALTASSQKHKMTLKKMASGDERGGNSKVYQHTQVIRPDGTLQCDVMILISNLGHHEVRDNVMDDSIDSIGQGAEGADTYGNHLMTNLGRDNALPHSGNGAVPKDQRGTVASSAPHAAAAPAKSAAEPAKAAETVKPAAPAPAPAKAAEQHAAVSAAPAASHSDTAHKAAPFVGGDIKSSHEHKDGHYDSDAKGFDSFGNATRSTRANQHSSGDVNQVFHNSFTIVTDDTTLFTTADGMDKAPGSLPRGTRLQVAKVQETKNGKVLLSRAQIITPEIGRERNIWINFTNLGGRPDANAIVPFGNELSDAKDKERADAIRAGLPSVCKPGQSKFQWRFGGNFLASFAGTALDAGLMSKVNALMNWAIQNDMVVDDVVIGEGMRDPRDAHYMSTRYYIAVKKMDPAYFDKEALKKLPGGRDHDGHLWYQPGWTDEQIIENASKQYSKSAHRAVAAEGYNFGDQRRAPMKVGGGQGVSAHCSGHAVDVTIPWRDPKNPTSKTPDYWAWEEIYHQFGLTRPLHKDFGREKSMQEHWHVEETGKQLDLSYDYEQGHK